MIITVVGLMFGDEGKGHTVAALTTKFNAKANVRFSGGSQAAHRVVHNGKAHIFAQVGSGSAVSSTVRTYLSNQMAVDPLNLAKELKVHQCNGLSDLSHRLIIDSECPIITVYHKALNQARELNREESGVGRISTTGLGVGEVMMDIEEDSIVIRAKDLCGSSSKLKSKIREVLRAKLGVISTFKPRAHSWFLSHISVDRYHAALINLRPLMERCVSGIFNERLDQEIEDGVVILEGSQGTLLDVDCGTKPYITRSKVTLSEADKLLKSYPNGERLNLGVIRGYIIRHGLGPLPSESANLTNLLPDPHTSFNEWQRDFRCGWLDLGLLKYSLQCNDGLHGLVITNLDRLPANSSYFDFDGKQIMMSSPETVIEEFIYPMKLYVYGTSWGEEGPWVWR